jgi:hypothetical protein
MAYRVRKLEHLRSIIVPFFTQHSLKTGKRQDFEKFRRVLLMMERGDHLNANGLEEIRRVAKQMNRGRARELEELIKVKSDSSGNSGD